jgi:hypothetical protein
VCGECGRQNCAEVLWINSLENVKLDDREGDVMIKFILWVEVED